MVVDRKHCRECGKSLLRGERRTANALQPWLVLLGNCKRDDLPYTSTDVFCNKCRLKIMKGERASEPLLESLPIDTEVIAANKTITSTEMEQSNIRLDEDALKLNMDMDRPEMSMDMDAPEMSMDMDAPEVSMDMDEPEVSMDMDAGPNKECPPMECDITNDAVNSVRNIACISLKGLECKFILFQEYPN